MALCNNVPVSAYELDGLGGTCWQSLTLPGQLMTRLAVLPPTILLCDTELSCTTFDARLDLTFLLVKHLFVNYYLTMREKTIEEYLTWAVEIIGGVTFKFRSPSQRGVADRIVCLPNGQTWFVELKAPHGRLSPLQKVFADVMKQTNQRYIALWDTEQVDAWIASISRDWR